MKKLLLTSLICVSAITTFAQAVVTGISPASIQGNYDFGVQVACGAWPGETDDGTWGSTQDSINFNVNGTFIQDTLMLVEDGTPGTNPQGNPMSQEGCNPLINDLTGKIAVIYRNTCEFGAKVLNAQNAGAVAAIIVNRENALVGMLGGVQGVDVHIPAVFLSDVDGNQLIAEMQNGPVVMFIGNRIGAFENDIGTGMEAVMRAENASTPRQLAMTSADFSVDIGARVTNYGINDQTNVMLTATVELDGSVLYTESSAPVDLSVGGKIVITGLNAGNYDNWSVNLAGCTGTDASVTSLTDPSAPTFAVALTSDPSSCGGADGSITISGLTPGSTYDIGYEDDTLVPLAGQIADAGGDIVITGLNAGNYDNWSVNLAGCTGTDATVITLTDPSAPTFAVALTSDPSSCGGADGSITISGLTPGAAYDIGYEDDTIVPLAGQIADTVGNIVITGLNGGNYDNWSVNLAGCTGTDATVITLTDPSAPTFAVALTSGPSSCGGADGSITISGLTPEATYDIGYEDDGTPVTLAGQTADSRTTLIQLPAFSEPTYDMGYYDVTYAVTSDSVDGFPYDNVIDADFQISNHLLSLGQLDTNMVPEPGAFYRGVNTGTNVDFTTCMHFMDPQASRILATGMYFAASGGLGDSLTGTYVQLYAYEWSDVFTDVNDPAYNNTSLLLNQVASGEYDYLSDLQREFVHAPLNSLVGGPLPMTDNTRYLFCVQTNTEGLYISHDSDADYTLNRETYAQPLCAVQVDLNWNANGFGPDVVPSTAVTVVGATAIDEIEDPNILAYPNPTANLVTFRFGDNINLSSISVLDVTGDLVKQRAINNNGSANITLDVSNLANGQYIFVLTEENGRASHVKVTIAK